MSDDVWGNGRLPGSATCPFGHLVPVRDAPDGRELRADESCPQCACLNRVLDAIDAMATYGVSRSPDEAIRLGLSLIRAARATKEAK